MINQQPYLQQPSQQPVRFYKIVALTFLCVTALLLGSIVFMSSRRAHITIITRSEPVQTQKNINVGDGIDSPVSAFVTTTIVSMDENYSPKGEKKVDAQARGYITIINDSEFDQPLVATTRFWTPDKIQFRIKDAVLVPAKGSVSAYVQADEVGAGGEVGPTTFSIPGLKDDKQKLIYARSEDAMTGGVRSVGILTMDDVKEAEQKMQASILKKAEASFGIVPEGQGVLYSIVQYNIDHDGDILGEEIDSFRLNGKATVAVVYYDITEMKDYAQKQLAQYVLDNNEILESSESDPSVSIESVDVDAHTATLIITYNGFVNIDQNSNELQKIMFFGKTEDEVRRYVMSLNHVQGVEMNFKPLWNRSVPHVDDHLTVMVRQVE